MTGIIGRIAILGGIDLDFVCRSTQSKITKRAKAMLVHTAAGGSYALAPATAYRIVPDENFLADSGRLGRIGRRCAYHGACGVGKTVRPLITGAKYNERLWWLCHHTPDFRIDHSLVLQRPVPPPLVLIWPGRRSGYQHAGRKRWGCSA